MRDRLYHSPGCARHSGGRCTCGVDDAAEEIAPLGWLGIAILALALGVALALLLWG